MSKVACQIEQIVYALKDIENACRCQDFSDSDCRIISRYKSRATLDGIDDVMAEVKRLERIEAAARDLIYGVVAHSDTDVCVQIDDVQALREALKESETE